MYKKVLVPIAFDDEHDPAPAITIARRLADGDAEITLLHVIEQIPGYAVSYLPAGYRAEAKKALQAELSGIASGVPGAKVVVVEGHSGRTILDYAEKSGADLIVIASHKPGMQDLLLGSTASQVVRHAKCAVHVLR